MKLMRKSTEVENDGKKSKFSYKIMAWNNLRSNYSIRFSQKSKNQEANNELTRLRKGKNQLSLQHCIIPSI